MAISRQAKHGTQRLYEIAYRDRFDADNRGAWRCWAYNVEHALEVFYDDDDDGWKHTSIQLAKEVTR